MSRRDELQGVFGTAMSAYAGHAFEQEGAPDTGGPECPFCHGHHGYPDNPCADMRSADRTARGAYFGGKLETTMLGVPPEGFEAAQRAVTELQLAAGKLREATSGYDYLRSMAGVLEAHIALHHLAEALRERKRP